MLRSYLCIGLLLSCALVRGEQSINDLQIGTTIIGPNFTVEDMRGKVVLLDLWGSDGPGFIAKMPQYGALYEKYKEDGLYVASVNVFRDSEDDARASLVGKRLNYQVSINGSFSNAPGNFKERRVLIGHDGKVIEDDLDLSYLEPKIKAALAKKQAAIAGPGPYKRLGTLAAQARTGKDLGTVMKSLEARKAAKDPEEAEEAKKMYDALAAAAKERMDDAMRFKKIDVSDCLNRLNNLTKLFAGSEPAVKAQQEADAIRKDPKTKDELAATAMLGELRKIEATFKPMKRVKDEKKEIKSDEFRKLNAEPLQRLYAGCNALTQRYPATLAAEKAKELLSTYK